MGNVDATVVSEQPKISHREFSGDQRINRRPLCEIARDRCRNVKATTSEKVGFVGREEGIEAQAVVLLV